FAGIAAAKNLYNKLPFEEKTEIILIDRNKFTVMLPSLPDVAGTRVQEKYLVEDIEKLLPKGVKFFNKTVDSVDFNKKIIIAGSEQLKYDRLIFAPGSKTNFFGASADFQKNMKLDCLEDAIRIREAFAKALKEKEELNVVITGAGFTGMELATNLYHHAKKSGKNVQFYLVEKFGRLLPMLSEERATYVLGKMKRLGLNFLTNEEVVTYENKVITLKSGKVIDHAFFCCCSGVQLAVPAIGKHKALPDGRILVDDTLRIPEHPEVYVIGDAAAVKNGEGFIRRAVNFAYTQGKLTGKNIAAEILKQNLKKYKPVDLGWVIPLYTTSVGEALSIKTKGRLGITMHYVMCGLKNFSIKNILAYVGFAFSFVFTQPKKQ
ncbi:MAG: FAD-dependent oxidoreductase, partial [Gloeobacteraceae cyanobacterium ES-bin-316]|nr:FAD-dependent oxidoreductase [Ferruginibacter sp.]